MEFQSLNNAIAHAAMVNWGYAPDIDSIECKISRGPLDAKDFKPLVIRAIFAAFGLAVPTDADLRQREEAKKKETAQARENFLRFLRGGASGIKEINQISLKKKSGIALREVDLSECDMSEVNLRTMDLQKASFARARLPGSILDSCNLTGACLKECKLDGASMKYVQSVKADFSQSSCVGVNLSGGILKNAIFRGANLTDAILDQADICGADLSDANLTGVTCSGTRYDGKTILPEVFVEVDGMVWSGKRRKPAATLQLVGSDPTEPLDFTTFLERLKTSLDKERVKKALKMLQAETFQLYCNLNENSLVGVVKSQTVGELVYSCRLTQKGEFCCGTQNLKHCGGLRGSLCKHLLVLVIGLTKAGELDPNLADKWVRASLAQQPKMDKDMMAETFLRYKGAQSGDIDWRPTETMPEDYYAF
jgi:uncharacterized protein YjbI with pentapeptide repeats